MHLSRFARTLFRIFTGVVVAVLLVPLGLVALLSFNTSKLFSWPPKGLTVRWWNQALHDDVVRNALSNSVKTALVATAIALVLGTMAAFAVQRYRFFGREAVSFLIVLPIALPGIVTGIAFSRSFNAFGLNLGFLTLVIAHATFCIVTVYNNMLARLRRVSPNLEEASADLGAGPMQTFGYVTFPLIRSALLAGGLLSFALSFDEIIVTTFAAGAGIDTLPLFIFKNFLRPNNLPIVNVVATAVVLLSIIPVWIAQRLSDGAPSSR